MTSLEGRFGLPCWPFIMLSLLSMLDLLSNLLFAPLCTEISGAIAIFL